MRFYGKVVAASLTDRTVTVQCDAPVGGIMTGELAIVETGLSADHFGRMFDKVVDETAKRSRLQRFIRNDDPDWVG